MKLYIFAILMLLVSTGFGQTLQDFQLTNVADEKTVSLKSFSSKPVVIIFSTINCPYAEYYLNRIKTIAEIYKDKIQVLMINPSAEQNESVQAMAGYAKQCSLPFPYLADKEQKVMALLNPHKSPECFLLQHTGGKFSVVYKGAIDDNAQSLEDVNHPYLSDAIEKLLAGRKIEPMEVRPVGCSLKKIN